jgi:rhodanese-related sulfurtransferase
MTIRAMAAVPRISNQELKQRLDVHAAPLLLDVRLKYPYEHSTITLPGAVRMPPAALDLTRLPKDREIVVYDSDPEELVASSVAQVLIREGYTARVLAGGVAAWMAAKLPTDTKTAPQPAVPGSLKD